MEYNNMDENARGILTIRFDLDTKKNGKILSW